MKIKKKVMKVKGIRFYREINGKEIGRASLYIIYNDLHKEPFGFLEDVHVDKDQRKKGIATQLLNQVIDEAKKRGCYKIIATSRHNRPKVHKLYKRIGFKDQGVEFRLGF
jgi:GNAT superfamily N-acetyltransferase